MEEISLEDIAQGLSYILNEGTIKKYPRHYLGMSQLGHNCGRHLWFYFRWATFIEHTHKKERIFKAGHDSEAIIIKALERVGFKVSGTQIELKHFGDNLKGHIDGILDNVTDIENITILLEAKSAKNTSWEKWKANGVKVHNKQYYCQSQVYMHKMNLILALFVVLNKDNSELLFEFIEYNKHDAEALLKRGEDIVCSPVPVKGISTDPDYYECNWCEFERVCHKNEPFIKSCRTCQYIEVTEQGFFCHQFNTYRTLQEQKEACSNYNMMEV